MLIELTEDVSSRLEAYAESRGSTPERLIRRWVSTLPTPSKIKVCVECGEQYRGKNRYFCSRRCYERAPFPRLGIPMGALQDCYGMRVSTAALVLGVSVQRLQKVIRKFKLRNRFDMREENGKERGGC